MAIANGRESEKTVYVLGAGFSMPAGGPMQASLLSDIFELPEADDDVRECKEAFRNFLVDVFNISPSKLNFVSLEDVYTPIDRCLSDGVSLRNRSIAELEIIRGRMEYLISLAIEQSFSCTPQDRKEYVRDFRKALGCASVYSGEEGGTGSQRR